MKLTGDVWKSGFCFGLGVAALAVWLTKANGWEAITASAFFFASSYIWHISAGRAALPQKGERG